MHRGIAVAGRRDDFVRRRQRELDGESRAPARFADQAHLTAMFAHYSIGNRQTESRSLADLLGAEERVEDPIGELLGNPRSVVGNGDYQHIPVSPGGDRQPLASRLIVKRMLGIVDEVQEYLLQLRTIRGDARQRRIELGVQIDLMRTQRITT